MSRADEAAARMRKAQRILVAARRLLNDRDAEGSCNRAYYAMFNAAHAALLAIQTDSPPVLYKTHRALIAAFGKWVVLAGGMDPELGRALSAVQHQRQIADYVGDPPPLEDATWAVDQAEAFVTAIRTRFIAP